MNIWKILLILFANFSLYEQYKYNKTHPLVLMDAVYWEVKPFLFTNEDGEIDGIIPEIFKQAQYYCLRNNDTVKIIEFNHRISSRREFYDAVRSNISYGSGKLHGIHPKKAFWAPVLSNINSNDKSFEQNRNLRIFQLMKSKEIAIIVPRAFISLPNKILRGILSCQQIFVLAILLAVLFGMILWILERYQNDGFPTSFINGAGTGLYWSIVSMTTVGYGDITPGTVAGRFIACFWLFVGVMVGCVMTATMTDVVTGISDLSIFDKTVSVLEHSFEEKIAEKDYRARVVTAPSYHEVLELVRSGKVFAAMMNADVAAWYQAEISDDSQSTPLRIVHTLPANMYLNCFVPADVSDEMKEIFKCMYFQTDEVYTYSTEAYQRYIHTETLYIGSMKDLFNDNVYVQILVSIVSGLFLIGVAYDIVKYVNQKHVLETDKDTMDARTTILVQNGNESKKLKRFSDY